MALAHWPGYRKPRSQQSLLRTAKILMRLVCCVEPEGTWAAGEVADPGEEVGTQSLRVWAAGHRPFNKV